MNMWIYFWMYIGKFGYLTIICFSGRHKSMHSGICLPSTCTFREGKISCFNKLGYSQTWVPHGMLYSTPPKKRLAFPGYSRYVFPHNFQDFNFSKTIHSLYDVYMYIYIYVMYIYIYDYTIYILSLMIN